jgi:integrase
MAHREDRWHVVRDGVKVRTARYGTGKRWKVRYEVDGHARSTSFDKQTDADHFLATVVADQPRGTFLDPREARVTFKAYAEGWRSRAVHDPSTADRIERSLRRHVYPVLGSRPIGAIRTSEIEAWVAKASRELAPSTLRVTFAVVVAIFRSAVRDRVIAASPTDGVKLPAARARKVEPPSLDMLDRIANALPGRFRAVMPFVAGSGLRQGEAFGLEVGAVDFLRRHVVVGQQLKSLAGQRPYLDSPKTAESERTVPLAQVTLDVLAAHLAAFPPVEYEVADRSDPRRPTTRPVRLVFARPDGRPVSRAEWSALWTPAARAADLPPRTGCTSSGTCTRACSSATARASRPYRAGSATPPPRSRSTSTRTCGLTRTTPPGPPSRLRSAGLRRPQRVQRSVRDLVRAGQTACGRPVRHFIA